MSNDYFYSYTALTGHTLARSAAVTAIIDAIVVGFDKFPALQALREGRANAATDTGAANAYVLTTANTVTSYVANAVFIFKASATNTGATTVNVNGIGAKTIQRQAGTDLVAGDITINAMVMIAYDGTQFKLLTATSESAAAATSATAAAASATSASSSASSATSSASSATSSASAASASATAAANSVIKEIQIVVSSPTGAAITTGESKRYFSVGAKLNGLNLSTVAASVSTVSSSGLVTVAIHRVRSGASVEMLSTSITIDANEVDSATAATPAVIDLANDDVATGDQLHIDIDGAGTGAKGLNIRMTFA